MDDRKESALQRHPHLCILPWVQLLINPDGKALSCCEVPTSYPLGFFNENTLADIWNSPQLKSLRQSFLNGEQPTQCQSCYYKEDLLG